MTPDWLTMQIPRDIETAFAKNIEKKYLMVVQSAQDDE